MNAWANIRKARVPVAAKAPWEPVEAAEAPLEAAEASLEGLVRCCFVVAVEAAEAPVEAAEAPFFARASSSSFL